MSNHNLFIHGADGAARVASNQEILAAARETQTAPLVQESHLVVPPG